MDLSNCDFITGTDFEETSFVHGLKDPEPSWEKPWAASELECHRNDASRWWVYRPAILKLGTDLERKTIIAGLKDPVDKHRAMILQDL